MRLTLTREVRRRITARMSGFVQHCVIAKECPETFLLFLYKTPLFPRLVQVLRICFLSLSLSFSLPPSLLFCVCVCGYHKGWFIGELHNTSPVSSRAQRARVLAFWETSWKEHPIQGFSFFFFGPEWKAGFIETNDLISAHCKLLSGGGNQKLY